MFSGRFGSETGKATAGGKDVSRRIKAICVNR
jgi:hypothetical protein